MMWGLVPHLISENGAVFTDVHDGNWYVPVSYTHLSLPIFVDEISANTKGYELLFKAACMG